MKKKRTLQYTQYAVVSHTVFAARRGFAAFVKATGTARVLFLTFAWLKRRISSQGGLTAALVASLGVGAGC